MHENDNARLHPPPLSVATGERSSVPDPVRKTKADSDHHSLGTDKETSPRRRCSLGKVNRHDREQLATSNACNQTPSNKHTDVCCSALEDGADDGKEGGSEDGVLSRHTVSEPTCGETTNGLSSVVDGYNSAGVRGIDHRRSVHNTLEAVMTKGGCDDTCKGVVSANGGIVLLSWRCTRVKAIDEATLSGDEGHGQYQPIHND